MAPFSGNVLEFKSPTKEPHRFLFGLGGILLVRQSWVLREAQGAVYSCKSLV